MNLQEHIRKVLREDIKRSNYLNIIKDIVEPFKNDDCVCDIDMWYDDEDDMYSVYLIFGTEELNDKFTHDGKYHYIRKKIIAVKEAIKSYLPIDNLNVGSYGKPNCGWNPINESKEENKKEKKFNRLIQNVEDYLNSNEYPSVKRFTVYYEDTHDDVIVNIFFDAEEAVKLGGGINSVIKKVGKQVMCDLEVFPLDFKYYTHFDKGINESKETEPKYLSLIKVLVEPFKDEVGVCDINVSYDDEDDMYMVYLVIGIEEMNEKFTYGPDMNSHISKLKMGAKKTIKEYIPIDNLYVGWYGAPNCGWNSI
jgi:hypothetical protein